MRKLLFYILWIIVAIALPYSIKAQTTPFEGCPVTHVTGTH